MLDTRCSLFWLRFENFWELHCSCSEKIVRKKGLWSHCKVYKHRACNNPLDSDYLVLLAP